MNQFLTDLLRNDPYDALPESIKSVYSREEYMWLSDEQKGGLIDLECEPEVG
jgi:hypothetical protein